MYRHYASSRFVWWVSAIAIALGFATYVLLPDSALVVSGVIARNLWIVLGPIGAFCIQLLMQLLTLGEDKALTAREQERLSGIADERIRYLWDITGVAVIALLVCLSAGSLPGDSEELRVLVSFSAGLASWTALLAARLPSLYIEIRDFRWRLARERNSEEAYRAAMALLKDDGKNPEPKVPEPNELN